VEASNSLGGDVIGWRQSKTKGETVREVVIIWQRASVNMPIFAVDDPALDMTNTDHDLDKYREPEPR